MTVLTHALTPGPIVSDGRAKLTLMAPTGRFSLRLRDRDIPVLSKAIGIDLPNRIGARATGASCEILCLGPDEWQVLTHPDAAPALIAACADIYDKAPHSLTDVSEREVSVLIEGPGAAELLTIGCPRDIDAIPVGTGCRTVVDGVTVVLWRDGEQGFRIDLWRSFAGHVIDLLKTGCTELAAEA